MKAVPRCLLVLGGGSAGVELAQVVRRLGGEVVLVEGADRVLPREPAPLGAALGEALRRDGIELMLGMHATAARREGDEYVLQLDGHTELRGDRLLVATGRRPRVEGIGLETIGVQAGPHGIPVDEHLRAGERLWAIGDVNGIWPLTHVGEYEGDVVAANIAGDARTCCGGTAWSRGGLRVRAGGGTRRLRTCLRLSVSWCWGRSGERADGSPDQAHHDLLRDARTDRRDGLLPAHAPGM
ncbi:MAG: FAD-dependent oxidoreductase [Streptosporangiaceae bacterium]